MRYLGSKTLLLNEIYKIAENCVSNGVFCDPFGGIGTVGSFMKSKGYQVISGDILNFAHYFQVALIENNQLPEFLKLKKFMGVKTTDEIVLFLNNQISENGWLIEEYAKNRKYFTLENAKYIQGCVDCINLWKNEDLLLTVEYKVLIASLIQSFDKVANTAGTYYAYLKDYYRKAKKRFKYELIEPIQSEKNNKAYLLDAIDLVKKNDCDILYLDPPYNERNYFRYYHLPETISYGITPTPNGKSGVYVNNDCISEFNKKSKATVAFDELIQYARAKFIIFHYTDNGIIDCNDARKILKKKGKVCEFYFDCKGYTTNINSKKCRHHIFLTIC